MKHLIFPALCAALSLAACAMAFKHRFDEDEAVFYSATGFITSALGLYILFHA